MNSMGALTGTNQKVDGQRAKVKPMEHGKQANKVLYEEARHGKGKV